MKLALAPFAAAALMLAAAPAIAQEADKIDKAVKARQSLMTLYSFNLGLLGGMAKGEIAYDAEAAKHAADNLAALTAIDQTGMWPEGSDIETLGEKKSAALPVIWTKTAEFAEDRDALTKVAAEFAGAAGTDLDALKAGIGPVGKACGACHEDFRQKQN